MDTSTLEAVGEHPLIGALINDRYVVDSVIGKGSSGIVYKATRLLMGREVAVKVLHSYLGAEVGALDRFLREARAASRLRHPHIINIWESGVTDDAQPYFVMDYLEGMTLADLVKQKGYLHAGRAMPIITQICEALSEAHRQNIIHRDIKPENIVLETNEGDNNFDDYVKVLDFGIADAPSGTPGMPKQKTAAGSPAYMSPEQCQGFELDQRSDIYSLAIVIFEMLTGMRPFAADDVMKLFYMHVSQPPPTLSSMRSDLRFPMQVELAVSKALAKNPDNRQQSIKEFQKELEEAFASSDMSAGKRESVTVDLFSMPVGESLMDGGGSSTTTGSHNFLPGPEDWDEPSEEAVLPAKTASAPAPAPAAAPASAQSDTPDVSAAVNRLLKSAKRASEAVKQEDVGTWARDVLTRSEEHNDAAKKEAPKPVKASGGQGPPENSGPEISNWAHKVLSRQNTGDLPAPSNTSSNAQSGAAAKSAPATTPAATQAAASAATPAGAPRPAQTGTQAGVQAGAQRPMGTSANSPATAPGAARPPQSVPTQQPPASPVARAPQPPGVQGGASGSAPSAPNAAQKTPSSVAGGNTPSGAPAPRPGAASPAGAAESMQTKQGGKIGKPIELLKAKSAADAARRNSGELSKQIEEPAPQSQSLNSTAPSPKPLNTNNAAANAAPEMVAQSGLTDISSDMDSLLDDLIGSDKPAAVPPASSAPAASSMQSPAAQAPRPIMPASKVGEHTAKLNPAALNAMASGASQPGAATPPKSGAPLPGTTGGAGAAANSPVKPGMPAPNAQAKPNVPAPNTAKPTVPAPAAARPGTSVPNAPAAAKPGTSLPNAPAAAKPGTSLPNAPAAAKPGTSLPNAPAAPKPSTSLPNAPAAAKPSTSLPNAPAAARPNSSLPNAPQTPVSAQSAPGAESTGTERAAMDLSRFDQPVNKSSEPLNPFAQAIDGLLDAAIMKETQEDVRRSANKLKRMEAPAGTPDPLDPARFEQPINTRASFDPARFENPINREALPDAASADTSRFDQPVNKGFISGSSAGSKMLGASEAEKNAIEPAAASTSFDINRFEHPINRAEESLNPFAQAVDGLLDSARIKPEPKPIAASPSDLGQTAAIVGKPPDAAAIEALDSTAEEDRVHDAVSRLIEAAKRSPEPTQKPEVLNKKIEAVKKKIEALKAADVAKPISSGVPPEEAPASAAPAPVPAPFVPSPSDSNSLSDAVNRLLEAAQRQETTTNAPAVPPQMVNPFADAYSSPAPPPVVFGGNSPATSSTTSQTSLPVSNPFDAGASTSMVNPFAQVKAPDPKSSGNFRSSANVPAAAAPDPTKKPPEGSAFQNYVSAPTDRMTRAAELINNAIKSSKTPEVTQDYYSGFKSDPKQMQAERAETLKKSRARVRKNFQGPAKPPLWVAAILALLVGGFALWYGGFLPFLPFGPAKQAAPTSLEAYIKQGKFEKARELLEAKKKAGTLTPAETDKMNNVYYQLGLKEGKEENYQDAVKDLKNVSRKSDLYPSAAAKIREYKKKMSDL
ncbi:MAG TPA: protein kinase [Drouetiella sp.]